MTHTPFLTSGPQEQAAHGNQAGMRQSVAQQVSLGSSLGGVCMGQKNQEGKAYSTGSTEDHQKTS